MTRKPAACAALLLALASGCAAQHEEARSEAAPASERDYQALDEEQRAPEPAAPADDMEDSPRSFEELQRELAANHAKLRELGIVRAEPAPVKERAATGTKATVTPAPAGQAKPSQAGRESTSSKRDKGGGKAKEPKDEAANDLVQDRAQDPAKDLGGSVRPDEAKATSMSPGGLDPVARCQQVCDLAAISCGLGDQICELADRHPDEPDYLSACERANADCEAAKEACDACAE